MRTIIIKYSLSIMLIIFLVLAIMAFDKQILEEDKLLLKTRFKTWATEQMSLKSTDDIEVGIYRESTKTFTQSE